MTSLGTNSTPKEAVGTNTLGFALTGILFATANVAAVLMVADCANSACAGVPLAESGVAVWMTATAFFSASALWMRAWSAVGFWNPPIRLEAKQSVFRFDGRFAVGDLFIATLATFSAAGFPALSWVFGSHVDVAILVSMTTYWIVVFYVAIPARLASQ